MTFGSQTGMSGVRLFKSLKSTVTSEKTMTSQATVAAINENRAKALVFKRVLFNYPVEGAC